MYLKNFSERNIIKQQTDQSESPRFFIGTGKIWYVKLGCNIGHEIDGKGKQFLRPVLVISKIGNMFFVAPLTKWWKDDSKFYYKLKSVNYKYPSRVVLNHAKTIDKNRFIHTIGEISQKEFLYIKKLLKELYLPGV